MFHWLSVSKQLGVLKIKVSIGVIDVLSFVTADQVLSLLSAASKKWKLNGSTILIQYWNCQNLWCCYDKLMLSLCYLSLERKVVCSGKEDWGQGYYQLLQLLTTRDNNSQPLLPSLQQHQMSTLHHLQSMRKSMKMVEKYPKEKEPLWFSWLRRILISWLSTCLLLIASLDCVSLSPLQSALSSWWSFVCPSIIGFK